MLELKNFEVYLKNEENNKEKKIIGPISFKAEKITAIVGPNGVGKSSIVNAIMNAPWFETKGKIILEKKDITKLKTEEKVKKGLFLIFQNPPSIPGVTLSSLLINMFNEEPKIIEEKSIKELEYWNLPKEFFNRELEGLSGGERKKIELIIASIAKPKYLLLDEVDSGLDFESLKKLIDYIKKKKEIKNYLIISHNIPFIKDLKPDNIFLITKNKELKKINLKELENLFNKGYFTE